MNQPFGRDTLEAPRAVLASARLMRKDFMAVSYLRSELRRSEMFYSALPSSFYIRLVRALTPSQSCFLRKIRQYLLCTQGMPAKHFSSPCLRCTKSLGSCNCRGTQGQVLGRSHIYRLVPHDWNVGHEIGQG